MSALTPPDIEPLLPENLSDEAATALCDFLYHLAAACESRYLPQLQRYRSGQLNLYDPEQPWLSPPRRRRTSR